MASTFYDTLQVLQRANADVIKASFRALAQRYHPDHNPEDIGRAQLNMQRLNEAYEVLSDPERRRRYDDTLRDLADRTDPGGSRRKQDAAREKEQQVTLEQAARDEIRGPAWREEALRVYLYFSDLGRLSG